MTWRRALALSILCAALGSSDRVHARQAPAFVEPIFDPAAGKTMYVLSARQPYTVWILVDNQCGWAQSLDLSDGTHQWVEPGQKWIQIATSSAVRGMNPLTITHGASGQLVGATSFTCEPNQASYQPPEVKWVDQPSSGESKLSPYAPFVLKLTSKSDPNSPARLDLSSFLGSGFTVPSGNRTPPATGAVPPAPAIEDYPALPIPGANPPPPDDEWVKPDEPGNPSKIGPDMRPLKTPEEEYGGKLPGFIYVGANSTYFIQFSVDNQCDHPATLSTRFNTNWNDLNESMGPSQTFIAAANRVSTFLAEMVPSPAYRAAIATGRQPNIQGYARLYGMDPTFDDCNGPPDQQLAEFHVKVGSNAPDGPHPSGSIFPGGTFTFTPTPTTPGEPSVPKTATPGATAYGVPGTFGGCSDTTDCLPFDTCIGGTCGDPPTPPDSSDSGFQILGAETVRIHIEISTQHAAVPRPLNPLGLLSRSFNEFVEWWMPTLEAAEQNLQKGLQFLITSQGGSTGKNLTMQVLNFTGKPMNLEGMLALEPLKKDAQQKMTQAFAKLAGRQLPTKVDLNAYCFEFLKLPPIAGQVMRVAPPDIQKRFEPLKKIMAAANRLTATGALKPDSTPAAYADSIKQWAIWTTQEKFNQSKFGEAFVHHTQKNVEAAGQKWSKQIEDVVRQRVPGRWQDIVQILKTAGAGVPQ
jgi:hypothetical protein